VRVLILASALVFSYVNINNVFAATLPAPYGAIAKNIFSRSGAVFSGKVIDIKKTYEEKKSGNPDKLNSKISFKIDKIWKGVDSQNATIEITVLNYKSCPGYYDDFAMNEEYLVFTDKGSLSVNWDCSIEKLESVWSSPPSASLPSPIYKISEIAHTKSLSDSKHTMLEEYMDVLGKPSITFEHKD
jgi:hypothetical protein